jgi:hypothetical protein
MPQDKAFLILKRCIIIKSKYDNFLLEIMDFDCKIRSDDINGLNEVNQTSI